MRSAIVPGIRESCRALPQRSSGRNQRRPSLGMDQFECSRREPASSRWFSKCFAGFLLVTVCIVLVACHRTSASASTTMMSYEIAPTPARVGLTEITVILKDAASKPVTAAHVTLEADMAHPGMTPIFTETKESVPGSYAGKLSFNMPGDWAILVHATLADGTRLERQIDIQGIEAR